MSKFEFSSVQYRYARSKEIGSNEPPQRVGCSSVRVDCACGNVWTARDGNDLTNTVSGVTIQCPACHTSEVVHARVLGI